METNTPSIELNEAIEAIKIGLQSIHDHGESLDDASWGYQQGLLITGNQGQAILNALSLPAPPKEALSWKEAQNQLIESWKKAMELKKEMFLKQIKTLEEENKRLQARLNYVESLIRRKFSEFQQTIKDKECSHPMAEYRPDGKYCATCGHDLNYTKS